MVRCNGVEPVGGLLLQVGGQVDDGDGLEWALLHADAAPDAQLLRDGGDLVVGGHLDAELAHPDHGAGLLALLPAPLGLALVIVDNGDPGQGVTGVRVLPLVPFRRHPDAKSGLISLINFL